MQRLSFPAFMYAKQRYDENVQTGMQDKIWVEA
jgi:hypothetical protein